MELAGLAVEAVPVPVKDTVGRVAVLLNLDDDESLADGMEASARDEDALAGLGGGAVESLLDGAVNECFLELLPAHPIPQTRVDGSPLGCMQEVPAFGLGFASQLRGAVKWGMHLDGKALAGIKELDEQGKAGGGGGGVPLTEEEGAGSRPQLMKGFSLEGSLVDDALGLGAVDHFPEFADHRAVWELLAEECLEVAAAPDALHGEGFEEKGGGG